MTTTSPKPSFALITMLLPGPSRKREPAPYHFRVTYRNPDATEPGCVMTWEVLGGREGYQIALERTPAGEHVVRLRYAPWYGGPLALTSRLASRECGA